MLQQKEVQQQFDGTCSRRCLHVQTAVSIERNTCVHVDQVFVSNPSHIIGSASERDRRNYYCRKKLTAAKKVNSFINKTLNWVTLSSLFFVL